MCSYFWQRMESTDQGDLGDVVRAGGRGGTASSTASHPISIAAADDWQFPSEPVNFPPPLMEGPAEAYFGDPFANFQDPLLHGLAGTTAFFEGPDSARGLVKMNVEGDHGGGSAAAAASTDEMKRPCNIFSRVLQISPSGAKGSPVVSPRGIKPSPILTGGMIKMSTGAGCAVDHGGVQISSPRTPGIKRRKGQAKKVVCIPAPAEASNRPSGEIVPSDLWAWRKYGQKPIKGSPYPRGYYRCSSSKGCSARKQVERSRTDPNMLVITYTSEHNHPWPTQRNALAGSTRAQPTKNNSSASSKSSPHNQRRPVSVKEEHTETANMVSAPPIKEEAEKPMDDVEDHDFDRIFDQSYKCALPGSSQPDDFFADLGELEADPMSLVFSKEFLGDKSEEERGNKTLDPLFNIFDWAGNSFGEARRGGL